jgi:hypothetical protein
LLYSTSSKKGLPEKCCNPGTLIHTIALLEAAPKDEEKTTLQMIHFFPMLPERKKAWQNFGANIRFKSYSQSHPVFGP